MHIHQVMTAAHYRMVEGRDWLWDFLGRDCREILFESWGLHESDEHYPVSAVFNCASGEVRQLTVETGDRAWRWMHPTAHAGYVLACRDLGEQPWAEPGIEWINDPAVMIEKIAAALHPERRPDDADESYRWEGGDLDGEAWQDHHNQVNIKPE